MDRIFINDLRENIIVGCYPEERVRRQGVVLNLEIAADLQRAGITDELADTVNYAEIEARIHELAANSQFKLIEALAGAVGRLVLEYAPVRSVKVRVEKPRAASFARSIAVELEFNK